VVYPYTGVLSLALVAVIAGACQHRPPTSAEKLVLLGFGMLGVQWVAWAYYLYHVTPYGWFIHLLCTLGATFVLAGTCGLPRYSEEEIA
jgi:hypothetical protein